MSELAEAAKDLLKTIRKEIREGSKGSYYVSMDGIDEAQVRLSSAIDAFELMAHLDYIIEMITKAQVINPIGLVLIQPEAYDALRKAIDCWKEKQGQED